MNFDSFVFDFITHFHTVAVATAVAVTAFANRVLACACLIAKPEVNENRRNLHSLEPYAVINRIVIIDDDADDDGGDNDNKLR